MSMIGNFKRISKELLEQMKSDPSMIESIVFSEEENEDSLYIDKAWHGIHFLLTDSPWEGDKPLCNVILGGQEIGEDIGYGPARYLTPEEVKDVAKALMEIDINKLREKYDAKKFEELEIYPSIWKDEDEIEYLMGYYEEVVSYYSQAAENNDAMLLYLA